MICGILHNPTCVFASFVSESMGWLKMLTYHSKLLYDTLLKTIDAEMNAAGLGKDIISLVQIMAQNILLLMPDALNNQKKKKLQFTILGSYYIWCLWKT